MVGRHRHVQSYRLLCVLSGGSSENQLPIYATDGTASVPRRSLRGNGAALCDSLPARPTLVRDRHEGIGDERPKVSRQISDAQQCHFSTCTRNSSPFSVNPSESHGSHLLRLP